MNEAFVYMWYDSNTRKYYIGSRKGSPDDGYTHSSSVMESFKAHSVPEGFSRRVLAYGTEPDMRQLEIDLLNDRREKCWDKYYNVVVTFPPPPMRGKDNPGYKHGMSGTAEYKKKWREDNIEHVKANNRKYYEENREKIGAQVAKYKKDHPEMSKEIQKRYRENNPETKKETNRKWRKKNREHINEYNKEYFKNRRENASSIEREEYRIRHNRNRKELRARKKLEKQQAQASLDPFLS